MRLLCILLIFYLASAQTAWGEEIILQAGTSHIYASIANTPQSRERGLMHTTQLCENCGMLFVFPQAGKYKFWMKNTPLSLSIAFIDAGSRILSIAEMTANTLDMQDSREDALYVLEMNAGWFTKNRIYANDRIQGLQNIPIGR